MAEIAYQDLLVWLKKHPDYISLCKGVEADVALYIRFSIPPSVPVQSEKMGLADGATLVIDRQQDGTVVGLEIV